MNNNCPTNCACCQEDKREGIPEDIENIDEVEDEYNRLTDDEINNLAD
jgi:hypothetical protein